MAYSVRTKHEKLEELKSEQLSISADADRIVASAGNAQPGGCFCGLLSRFRRTRQLDETDRASIRSALGHVAGASSSVFGLAGSKGASSTSKLEHATLSLQARADALQARADAQRAEAQRLAQLPAQRPAAMRALKRAKVLESQANTAAASVLALESQLDMLEGAQLQRQVASALTSTSKSLKKDKKLLSRAEDAVDDAAEARDLASDLNGVLAEFTNNDTLDDADLEAELLAMASESAPPAVATAPAVDADAARRHDVEDAVAAMPAAPTGHVHASTSSSLS